MSNFSKQVTGILKDMRTSDMKQKGNAGELAVIKVIEQFYQEYGGILYHSYTYKVDKKLKGNIKKDESGKLYCENLGSTTEIDVLYVSPFRVFPIEVKSYSAKEIILTDDGISGCRKTDKSPVHQNEMHARHLLSAIFRALPDGDEKYIVPIVVFVDKCKLVDKRSDWQKEYIKKCILNSLSTRIRENNFPFEYTINLKLMDDVLRQACESSEKYLPVRYV